jgi:secondary thiamine-phosphate synthase enzyme
MAIITDRLSLSTQGHTSVIDITDSVKSALQKRDIKDGILNLFVPGSTAALTTIEYEPGAVEDLREAIERLIPRTVPYAHDSRWGDGNGYAHVRASFIGPSLTIPFRDGKLLLGTWQQIVFIDFDNRPRSREIIIQIVGEGDVRRKE